MDKPEGQNCLNCKFSFVMAENPQNLANPHIYACRRFPPNASRVLNGNQMMDVSLWPQVNETVWCHEYEVELVSLT